MSRLLPRIEPVHVAVIALIIIVTAAFITSTVAVLTVSKKADTASVQASAAKSVAVAIQRERTRSISENCRDQNRRHDMTISELDRLILKVPPGTRRDRAKQGRKSTVLLIEALVPKRDCTALAKRQAPPHKP